MGQDLNLAVPLGKANKFTQFANVVFDSVAILLIYLNGNGTTISPSVVKKAGDFYFVKDGTKFILYTLNTDEISVTRLGEKGDALNWLGELNTAPSSPNELDAYFNTVDGQSYIYNGTSWDKLSQKGIQGVPGSGVIIIDTLLIADILALTPAVGSMYIAENTDSGASVPGEAGDGYVYNASSWTNVGPIRGPKGEDGDDAPMVKIEYAINTNGDNSQTTPAATHEYISFSTDDGVTWSDWAKYIGDKGQPGDPGIDAKNVKIKYCTDTSGNTCQTTPSITYKYISFSTDDGSNWSTPTKYLGDDGNPGSPGSNAPMVKIKYAEDTNGTNVSFTPSASRKYINFSVDNGVIWSGWYKYLGDKGDQGIPGPTVVSVKGTNVAKINTTVGDEFILVETEDTPTVNSIQPISSKWAYSFISKLISSFQSIPDNNHFVTEKLVKNSLDNKVTANNNITALTTSAIRKIKHDVKGLITASTAATTDDLAEASSNPANLYFTMARVRTTTLSGLSIPTSSIVDITAANTVLEAFGKLQALINEIDSVISDLTTDDIPEKTTSPSNLYFTTARVKDVKLDDMATPDDNTDLNASNSRHGLLKKLIDDATKFLNSKGEWVVPNYINNTHLLHTGDVEGAFNSTALTIKNKVVTYAKIQDVPTLTVLGRVASSSGSVKALTKTELLTLIDSFNTTKRGLVGHPTTAEVTANKILRADNTWVSQINTQLSNTQVIAMELAGYSIATAPDTIATDDTILHAFEILEYRVSINDNKVSDQNHNVVGNLTNTPTAANVKILTSNGNDTIIPPATISKAGVMTAADRIKLNELKIQHYITASNDAPCGTLGLTTNVINDECASFETIRLNVSVNTPSLNELFVLDSNAITVIKACTLKIQYDIDCNVDTDVAIIYVYNKRTGYSVHNTFSRVYNKSVPQSYSKTITGIVANDGDVFELRVRNLKYVNGMRLTYFQVNLTLETI